VPLLLLDNGSGAAATAGPTRHAPASPVLTATTRPPSDHPRVGHGSTHPSRVVAPATAPVVIAAAPVREVVPTTTTTSTVPATTTTTTEVAPTTTTTTTTTRPIVLAGDQVQTTGQVTYYAHPAGRCASPWLPFGTVVRVTNPANGASVTCVVDDREQDTARAIDLATATFAEIAPLSQGVVDAELGW